MTPALLFRPAKVMQACSICRGALVSKVQIRHESARSDFTLPTSTPPWHTREWTFAPRNPGSQPCCSEGKGGDGREGGRRHTDTSGKGEGGEGGRPIHQAGRSERFFRRRGRAGGRAGKRGRCRQRARGTGKGVELFDRAVFYCLGACRMLVTAMGTCNIIHTEYMVLLTNSPLFCVISVGLSFAAGMRHEGVGSTLFLLPLFCPAHRH